MSRERPKCRALYDYDGSGTPGDLSFVTGDVITIISTQSQWWTGELRGRTGGFPSNYVNMLDTQPRVVGNRLCKALYDYNGTTNDDLTFRRGDVIEITDSSGAWWRGTLQGKSGVFPSNYVDRSDIQS
ncbi:hypothetical protein Pelo_13726 [Pelomyxa schiedti]|nr:hypothetical protein Pelo_13726 [Pelomyxa schiedti]